MTTIYNISPGFLQIYKTYQGKDKLNPEEIFKRLSIEMGGDGKTISKKQLDDYIDKADKGLIDIDKSRLSALKRIQKNWDVLFDGADSITYSDMEKYKGLLLSTVIGNFTKTEISDDSSYADASAEDAICDYLIDAMGLDSSDDIKQEHLESYLNELLSDNSDENSELIGTLTNMIASYSPFSTLEEEV